MLAQLHTPDLQFNVVEHCNLRCVECSHFSPWMAVRSMSLEGFRRDITALATALHTERFHFVGGEPLLHRDLIKFIEAVREAGITDCIAVTTNGALVDRMPDEFFRVIDRLELSKYPGTSTTDEKVGFARDRCARFEKAFQLLDRPEFRLMQLDRPNQDETMVREIYDSCLIAHVWNCHAIRDGMYYKCARPLFTREYLARKGVEAPNFAELDGVAIHAPGLGDRLRAYLADKMPLASCQFCLGTVGKLVRQRQLSREEVASTAAEPREPSRMVDHRLMRSIQRQRKVEKVARALLPRSAYQTLRTAGSKIRPRREKAGDERKA